MRRAPPIVVQVQRQPAVQAVVALLALTAAGALVAWAVSHQPQAWPLVVLLPLAAGFGWREAAPRPRRLRWDGEAWWLAPAAAGDETAVRVEVLIDLDHWLLLRATPGPVWLALARRQQAPQWGALRATLYAAPARAPEA